MAQRTRKTTVPSKQKKTKNKKKKNRKRDVKTTSKRGGWL